MKKINILSVLGWQFSYVEQFPAPNHQLLSFSFIPQLKQVELIFYKSFSGNRRVKSTAKHLHSNNLPSFNTSPRAVQFLSWKSDGKMFCLYNQNLKIKIKNDWTQENWFKLLFNYYYVVLLLNIHSLLCAPRNLSINYYFFTSVMNRLLTVSLTVRSPTELNSSSLCE